MESRQTPTFEANFPADLDGDGDAAIALATAYFGEPLEWQERPAQRHVAPAYGARPRFTAVEMPTDYAAVQLAQGSMQPHIDYMRSLAT